VSQDGSGNNRVLQRPVRDSGPLLGGGVAVDFHKEVAGGNHIPLYFTMSRGAAIVGIGVQELKKGNNNVRNDSLKTRTNLPVCSWYDSKNWAPQ
ncbi:hypothetical protein HAX54_028846, partial [Datura stramonium]|nr:hypothetical protein [Datura stramonium]